MTCAVIEGRSSAIEHVCENLELPSIVIERIDKCIETLKKAKLEFQVGLDFVQPPPPPPQPPAPPPPPPPPPLVSAPKISLKIANRLLSTLTKHKASQTDEKKAYFLNDLRAALK